MKPVTAPVANILLHPSAAATPETESISLWLDEFIATQYDSSLFYKEVAERQLASTTPGDLVKTLIEDVLSELQLDDFSPTGASFLNCFLRQGMMRIDWELLGEAFVKRYSTRTGSKTSCA